MKSFLIPLIFLTVNLELGKSQDFRLPNALIPTHYALHMQPILDETPGHTRFTAPGSVKITVNCTEDTDTVKVHSLDLIILENATKVTNADNGETIEISNQGVEPENHFFTIKLGSSLQTGGKYDIYIEYIASVSETRLDGMYLDKYVDPETSETKYVATTLFAAISARRCFPCFDEPQFKAIFSISLGRKEGYHSLSNMHQLTTEPLPDMDGWFVDKFAPSLPMSTYLVAMIVSDLTYEETNLPSRNPSGNNATFRVYAPYYFINRGGGIYAANQTKNVLSKFEEYFDNTFTLQKLDSVSLPRFFFSAMENWGLITYNDRVLLYFPGETTEQERYRITSIIAHEVVHHYFGNTVTCEWWTWIWLNEGSATYFSHLGVEMTYPEFNPWDRFINDVYQVALEFDASPLTHPVANEPKSLADIGGIYNDIAYEKGASLLRMMRSFLTESVMKTGIGRYLRENQFQNVRQDQLFQTLGGLAVEHNVTLPATLKEIMDTWTLQSGFPLLQVRRISSDEVQFTQNRFHSSPNSTGFDERWWIPLQISVIIPIPKEYFFWMPSDSNTTVVRIPEAEVFVLNSRSEGYYRTMYSPEILQQILQSQRNGEDCISSESKLNSRAKSKLLDDYIAFNKANLSAINMEDIVEALCLQEENLVVWETLLKHYTKELLETYWSHNFTNADKLKNSMKKTLLPKINGALKRLEKMFDKNIGENLMLRSELLFWSCLLEREQRICSGDYTEGKIKSKEEIEISEAAFQADFADTYFCTAVSHNDTQFHKVYEVALSKRKMPCAYTRTLSALACTSNEKLFEKVFHKLQKEVEEIVGDGGSRKLRISGENLPVIRAALRIVVNENIRFKLKA